MTDMATRKITVIDGGFATQLTNHVGQVVDGNPLWSASFLASDPEAVMQTHLDFLRADADVIMTNTYQASVGGFITYLGLDEKESLKLIATAVDLAKRACDIYMKENSGNTDKTRPLIVGSVGPYGASLHDFSEYTGDYVDRVSKEVMRDWHRPRIQALLDAGVDFLALETIPAQAEAEMLAELMKEFPGKKAWISFSCKDESRLCHGELFQEAARTCWELNPTQIIAMGVNCLNPKLVAPLIRGINKNRENNPIPLVVYPNSGENYDPTRGGEIDSIDLTPPSEENVDPERGWWVDGDKCEPIETYVREWLDLGVTFVGGCCRTYDTDVRKIRTQVEKWTASRKIK